MVLEILKYFLLPYIFNAKISQAHLLHVSRQVHFQENTRIWQGEYMPKVGSVLWSVSEIIDIIILSWYNICAFFNRKFVTS